MPSIRRTHINRTRFKRTLGVDTGGTFTDVVLREDGELRVAKVASTPDDPARGVLAGLEQLGGTGEGDHVVHGTTVALNALLTGSTARTVLVAGEGFADLIEIGRQERPEIYALEPRKPTPLVPRELRFEVAQRSWPDPSGKGLVTVKSPDSGELEELAAAVQKSGAESVAVCLLHAFADPAIETAVARALEPLGIPLTCSASILPEHREYERFSTAVVNAALAPLMRDYLGSLQERLGAARLYVLMSNGGTLPAPRAAVEPVRVLLSGPAGGVVGAARAAREAGFRRLVGLDMGGTSTDVAFHDVATDSPRGAGESGGSAADAASTVEPLRVAGYPVGVPALDIHTIGCGGGSLVTVDRGGMLHVGPESAGADPGPVCYGQSEQPTVTDAHVFLGHIAEGPFLSGELPLDLDAVQRAFGVLARELGVEPVEAARGVLAVAQAAMRRAIGVMTMQRGQDPGRVLLVAFGGAGGLHAAALAESLGMPAALVPRHPGALSAYGMTTADAIREHARSPLERLSSWSRTRRRRVFAELAAEGRESLVEAGHPQRAVACEHLLDLRYEGQSYELRLPECADPAAAFHEAHERLYGYRLADREVELVCLRARAVVRAEPPRFARPRSKPLPDEAIRGRRRAVFDRPRNAAVIDRACLRPGHRLDGPALVEEYSGTTLIPPGWRGRVTAGNHLLLERSRRGRPALQ
ncbi:MAG: hydantoinase/oxoprolinase family protein [Planctomycetota bacterium]|nr:hydantoinase/oxoprolinase family protein [Planctomycetota bacterium]